jgi:hypothetical protein
VNASDERGVTRVELYAGNTLVGSATDAPYGFSWDTNALAEGDVSLEARAFDAAGNVGSAAVTVRISNDTIPPSVTITNPQSGSVVSGPTTVSSSATDDKRVAKISLRIDSREVALVYGSTVSYLWDPYGSAKGKGNQRKVSGSHSITAIATDEAGNTRSASVSVTVQ